MFYQCWTLDDISLKTMTKYHKNVDWTNDQERYDFEEEIRMWKARRKEWTWCQTLVWILEIFVLNFLVILALYGGKLDTRNRYPNTSISILKDLSNIGRLTSSDNAHLNEYLFNFVSNISF